MAKRALMGIFLVLLLMNVAVRADGLPHAYVEVAEFCGVPPGLLYAVAITESGRSIDGKGTQPWPWTLNIEGRGLFFETRQAQFEALMDAISAGKVVDIGPMQLNWGWQYERLISPWRATDPIYNLTAGCRILREYYDVRGEGRSWVWAIGKYHRGSNEPRHVRAGEAYAKRVLRAWQTL